MIPLEVKNLGCSRIAYQCPSPGLEAQWPSEAAAESSSSRSLAAKAAYYRSTALRQISQHPPQSRKLPRVLPPHPYDAQLGHGQFHVASCPAHRSRWERSSTARKPAAENAYVPS